jgi:branched-chain amino acid transport system permease protein
VIAIMLAEGLRIGFGTKAIGWDNLVYACCWWSFIFPSKGILGSIAEN